MVDTDDSLTLISSVLLPLDPWDDRAGLLPVDPEVGVAVCTLGSCGEDDILRPNVWAGLGGGMGGMSLPGVDAFILKWLSRGLIGGGVESGPGLERERERERER